MTDTAAAPDLPLGRSIAERQRPLRARRGAIAGLSASPGRPGALGRRSTSFSMAAGLSLTSRRALGMVNPDPDVSWLPVAPPSEWDESLLPAERVRTGDATLDHIIATQQASRPTATGPRRGLRSAIGRRNTPTGRNTAPGASAHRLRPQSAPPALNPDVRKAVSGDSSRPRAPRSGPTGGPASSRAPSARTGRRARGRVERSAPWHHSSAQPTAPLTSRVDGPVAMSGRSVAGGPVVPSGFVPAVDIESAPVGVEPLDLPATVAGIAASVIDHAMGHPAADLSNSGWGLARSAMPLAPSVGAPGASNASARSGSATTRPAGTNRAASWPHAISEGVTPARGPLAPTTAAAARAIRGAAAGPAGAAAARMAERRRAAQPTAPGGDAATSPTPIVATSPAITPVSSGGEPTPMARANAAQMGAAISPPPGVPTGITGASPINAARPAAVRGEPALAAMLRAAPPALSLSTSPQRSFSMPSGSAPGASVPDATGTGTTAVGSIARGGVPSVPLAGAASVARRAAGPVPGVVGGMPLGTSGLAVAGGVAPTPGAAQLPGSASIPSRGLGSVASLVSTPTTRPRRSSTGARGVADSFGSVPAPPTLSLRGVAPEWASTGSTTADHARRAVRRLPDLAIPVPSMTVPSITVPSVSLPSAAGLPATGPQFAAGLARVAAGESAATPAATPPGARPGLPFTPSPSFTPSMRSTSLVDRAAPLAAARPAATQGQSTSAPTSGVPDTPSTRQVAPPPAVPVDPGERFDQVLAQHAGPSLSKLPQRFEPIARAILPDPQRVRVSTGRASRQALAAVGKVAATAGDVVHLARPLDLSRRSIDILAHELTHVANPSPLVRFFDDDRDSHEERQAREMGSVMAAAPVGSPPAAPPPRPSGSSGGAGWGPGNMPPLPPLPPPPAPSVEGQAGGPRVPPPAGAPAGTLPPWANQVPQLDGGGEGTPQAGAGAGVAPTLDIDRLLDALESRVIRELERRGRRWPRPM